jgi:hypothetical protein
VVARVAASKPLAAALVTEREQRAANRPSASGRAMATAPAVLPLPVQDQRGVQPPMSARAQAAEPAPAYQRPMPTRADSGAYPSHGASVPAVPEAAPAPVQAAGHPREQCGGRVFLALHACLVRQCVKPQYRDHEACVRVREIEERAARTPG